MREYIVVVNVYWSETLVNLVISKTVYRYIHVIYKRSLSIAVLIDEEGFLTRVWVKQKPKREYPHW